MLLRDFSDQPWVETALSISATKGDKYLGSIRSWNTICVTRPPVAALPAQRLCRTWRAIRRGLFSLGSEVASSIVQSMALGLDEGFGSEAFRSRCCSTTGRTTLRAFSSLRRWRKEPIQEPKGRSGPSGIIDRNIPLTNIDSENSIETSR